MIMHEKSFETQALMISLAVILTLVTIIGNGFFLAIFARFKVFRRYFTNFLFASLALADCLNALVNIPLFTLYFVVEADWLEGKTWAVIICSLHLEFGLLNLVSMTALMLDRFLAVYLDLEYFTWKTTRKAKTAVFLMWLGCTIAVMIASIPVFYMDLDGVPVLESRGMILRKRRVIITALLALFTLASTVLGIWTCCLIQQKKKERIQLNLPPLAAEARLKMDIKATYTVVMAVSMYYICYIPTVVFSIWRRTEEQQILNPWWAFMAAFLLFFSGALNPVIYVIRSRRNRSAIRQLLKDPCGTSAFRENPVRNENKAKQPDMKPPKIKGEELKDCRDSAASPNPDGDTRQAEDGAGPASDTRRPIAAKIQIHQSHSVVKNAWEEQEDSDEQVAVDEELMAGRRGEKEQDEECVSSGPVGHKRKKLKQQQMKPPQIKEEELKDISDKETVPEPTSATVPIHQSHSVVKKTWEKEKDSDSLPADENVAEARELRQGGKKDQVAEGEFAGSGRDKRTKMKTKAVRRNGIGHFAKVKVTPQTADCREQNAD